MRDLNTMGSLPGQRPRHGIACAARCLGLPLLVAILVWLPWGSVNADECAAWVGARIFASHFGMQGFKLTLDDSQRASGRLFTYDDRGAEKSIWESRLVNVPVDVYVAHEAPVVVTIDTACRAGFEHSVVMYGAKGAVIADYRLEDLLTPDEIEGRVKRTMSSRWWAEKARFAFDEQAKQFVITLSWGRTVRIALATGRIVASRNPRR
jgi:hypothetical protein